MNSKSPSQAVKPRARLIENVSCITFEVLENTFSASQPDYFHVPDEEFSSGNLTGIKVAWEIFATARDGSAFPFESVIKAACKVIEENKTGSAVYGSNRYGAAVGFLSSVGDMLEHASRSVGMDHVMAESMRSYEFVLEEDLRDLKNANAEFAKTMAKQDSETMQGH